MTKTTNPSTSPVGELAAPHTMRDIAAEALERRAKATDQSVGAEPPLTDAEAEALAAALAAAQAQADEEVIAATISEAITMKSFCPSAFWPNQETLGQPRGVHRPLGRIIAAINRTESVTTQFGQSIALCGLIRAIAFERNNLELTARKLFVSNSVSERLASLLASMQAKEPTAILIADLDVGMESTGKPNNSYAWTTVHYLRGEAAKASRAYLTAPRKIAGMVSGGGGSGTALPVAGGAA